MRCHHHNPSKKKDKKRYIGERRAHDSLRLGCCCALFVLSPFGKVVSRRPKLRRLEAAILLTSWRSAAKAGEAQTFGHVGFLRVLGGSIAGVQRVSGCRWRGNGAAPTLCNERCGCTCSRRIAASVLSATSRLRSAMTPRDFHCSSRELRRGGQKNKKLPAGGGARAPQVRRLRGAYVNRAEKQPLEPRRPLVLHSVCISPAPRPSCASKFSESR